MPTSLRSLSPLLAPALALLLGAGSAPARAEDLSVKVENYIFAASEALADGEPALALSLLRRAKAEAPESCIVDEYLCRTYAAIGNTKMARDSYTRFAACMEVTDESVLAELDALIVRLEHDTPEPAAPSPAKPVPPAPAPVPPTTVSPPPPVVVAPTPASGYPGRGVGWALFGSGVAVGAAGGVGTGLTWTRSERFVEQLDRESYEALIPWNHASVIGLGVGSALAVAGLGIELGLARHGRERVAIAPTVNGLILEVRR